LKYLDLTLPSPEENLACDETLLDWCDESDGPEILRFWEPHRHFIVVGYSNRVECEVNIAACRELNIPVLRRCSGGGTVVQGPGCLNYALILRFDSEPALQTVTGANRFVMERNRSALDNLLSRGSGRKEALSSQSAIVVRGHSDLAIDGRKFSGNAQRRRRHAVLFHGTFLLDFDLELVSRLLPMPSKEPDYRRARSHTEFLMNLNVSAAEIKAALTQACGAAVAVDGLPFAGTRELAIGKYSSEAWRLKF